jgi:hypothetical protein
MDGADLGVRVGRNECIEIGCLDNSLDLKDAGSVDECVRRYLPPVQNVIDDMIDTPEIYRRA